MITLYTKKACPDCIFYKRYLQNKGIEYSEEDIFSDTAQELIWPTGIMSAPVIAINNKLHVAKQANVGYISDLLGEAGYGQTGTNQRPVAA